MGGLEVDVEDAEHVNGEENYTKHYQPFLLPLQPCSSSSPHAFFGGGEDGKLDFGPGFVAGFSSAVSASVRRGRGEDEGKPNDDEEKQAAKDCCTPPLSRLKQRRESSARDYLQLL
ncbi:hypothetical protein COP1_028344 [Malus domestica]